MKITVENSKQGGKYILHRTLKLYMIAQIIVGVDHNYIETNTKTHKYLIKALCLIIIGGTTYSVLNYGKDVDSAIWYYIQTFEYLTITLVITLNRTSLADFTKAVDDIDVRLRIKRSHYTFLHVQIIVYTCITFAFRTLYTTFSCVWFNDNCIYNSVGCIMFVIMFTTDFIRILIVIVFSIVYFRVKTIRMHIKEMSSGNKRLYWTKQRFDNGNKTKSLGYLQKIYKDVADVLEFVKPLLDALFLVEILFNMPKILCMLYVTLIWIKTQVDLKLNFGAILYIATTIIHIVTLLSYPSVVSAWTSAEVNRIKVILHDQILTEEHDEKTTGDINRFLQYIEIRPFKYRAYELIPIDLSLPLSLISVCTTYLIVIIQLTHLYD